MPWSAQKKRDAYRSDPEYRAKRIAESARARKPFATWSPEQRERARLQKLKYRRTAGVKPLHAQGGRWLWESNARQAWRWWLARAPDWWMRSYYRAQGKPWNNPRLSNSAKWRIRYWCDPVFRAREIEKVQTLKAARALRIEATCDGTLTGAVIVGLFAAAKDCPYCHRRMRSVEKSLDHVVALSNGGAHSIGNVIVCCKTCNTRKGARAMPQRISITGESVDYV